MDSGRRSFVGTLLAFLLAPMAVGGCLMPRRKSRRIANTERLYPIKVPPTSLVVATDLIAKAKTIYGSQDLLDQFVRVWTKSFGDPLSDRVIHSEGRIHWLYDGQNSNMSAFESAILFMKINGTDVVEREQCDILCFRMNTTRVIFVQEEA